MPLPNGTTLGRWTAPWVAVALCVPAGSGCDGHHDTGPQHTGLPQVTADTADSGRTSTGETGRIPLPDPVRISDVTAALSPGMPTLITVDWTQDRDAEVHLEFSVDPGVWLSSPERVLGRGSHREVIVGVPYDTDVTWHIATLTDGVVTSDTTDGVVRTGPAPVDSPVHTVLTEIPELQDRTASPYVLLSLGPPAGTTGTWYALVVDRSGRPVWLHRAPPDRIILHPRLASDGRSVWVDHDSYWSALDLGRASTIVQLTLDGRQLAEYPTPGLNQGYTDTPQGSLVFGRAALIDEVLVELQPDLSERQLWSCRDWLEQIGQLSPLTVCGTNSVELDPATDHVLVSSWSLETVIEVDRSTGDTVRWFGHVPGAYAFDAEEDAFWWPHGAEITPKGTLLLSSDLVSSPGVGGDGVETLVREYTIRPQSNSLRQIWTMDEGARIYAGTQGDVARLPSGNTLHSLGGAARLREATPDGTLVWDVSWTAKTIGQISPIGSLYDLVGGRF